MLWITTLITVRVKRKRNIGKGMLEVRQERFNPFEFMFGMHSTGNIRNALSMSNRRLQPHLLGLEQRTASSAKSSAAVRRTCGGSCTKARSAASSYHAESVQNRFENEASASTDWAASR